MKSLLIYDSISGNTRKIAQAIFTGMKQTEGSCKIEKMKDVDPEDLQSFDLIGLGSPVHNLQEMGNVTKFLESAFKNLDGKHSFAFCTHGAHPGKYLARVVSAMARGGSIIIGWNDWFGSVFHPAVPKPYFTDGHPDELDLKEAEDFGREMVERSRRISKGETGLVPVFPEGADYERIYQPGPSPPKEAILNFQMEKARLAFKVNHEKCNYPKCSICRDYCPMKAIDFSVTPPLFEKSCEKCFLCVQTCPRGAIEVDWEPYHKAHLPLIAPLEASLRIFEARGKFRRLVPDEAIGWHTFVWQLKHPIYKLP